ncbi:hypothetical protein ACK32Z_22835 [Aeromonas hydrophila]|uniref:hypothetical protein n=1 Tax=Aeromonas hydrophila TaxID=644 RepID=UPI003987B636
MQQAGTAFGRTDLSGQRTESVQKWASATTLLYNYSIKAVLSHLDKNDIARVYNRGGKYFNRRVELMDWWSEHIEVASFKE